MATYALARRVLVAAFVALLAQLSLAGGAAAADEPQVAATVNGTPITEATVNQVVKSLIKSKGAPPSSEEIAQLHDAALASLIDLELLYGAAQQAQIKVSDKEVQDEINKIKVRVGSNDAAFAAALQASGLTEAQLASDTRKTMMVDRFVEQKLMKGVTVTPEAMQAFYEANKQEMRRGDKVPTYEQAKPLVEQALLESERRQRQETYLAELRKTAKIVRPTPKP
jgi:parvulin-like peptidyl-prolyl isomerase